MGVTISEGGKVGEMGGGGGEVGREEERLATLENDTER